MKRLDIIDHKLKSAKDLESIVKTMKGLAAVSISQYDHAVKSISSYYKTIEEGLHIVLHNEPQLTALIQPPQSKSEAKKIAIVFGAGQPMCGAFNEIIASFFNDHYDVTADYKIVTAGHRVMHNLQHYGWKAKYSFEIPSTVEKINETVQELVLLIQDWYSNENFAEVQLYHNLPSGSTRYEPVIRQLLPIDIDWLQKLGQQPWSGPSLPTFSMNSAMLMSALIKQFLFVSLYKACAESLSAENNSRLAAMQTAEKKIAEMIDELSKTYHNQRQVNITEEIMDIMGSFEVLRGSETGSDQSQ